MQYRTPEEAQAMQTAEGEQDSNFLPPCPTVIKGRRARSLWAKVAAKLSRNGKMTPSEALRLKSVFIRNAADPEELERAVTRYVQRNS